MRTAPAKKAKKIVVPPDAGWGPWQLYIMSEANTAWQLTSSEWYSTLHTCTYMLYTGMMPKGKNKESATLRICHTQDMPQLYLQ